jgi:hypothetical protein
MYLFWMDFRNVGLGLDCANSTPFEVHLFEDTKKEIQY